MLTVPFPSKLPMFKSKMCCFDSRARGLWPASQESCMHIRMQAHMHEDTDASEEAQVQRCIQEVSDASGGDREAL